MAAQLLYLIRHAAVTLLQDHPAPKWPRTVEGRALAGRLATAPVWRGLGLLAASPECKAQETAGPIAAAAGRKLRIEEDLREVQRGRTPITAPEDYRLMVAEFFDNLDRQVHGWEPGRAAQRRITACITALLAAIEGPVAIVSHGLILSLYLAALRGDAKPDQVEWRSIPLPAVAVVEPSSRRVVLPFVPVENFLEGFR